MKLSTLLYTLVITKHTSADDDEPVEIKCPCLSEDDLNRMPEAELDTSRSCNIQTINEVVEIWQQLPPIPPPPNNNARVDPRAYHHEMGYRVTLGESPQCLAQGDMMFMLTQEEADVCSGIIMAKCRSMGMGGFVPVITELERVEEEEEGDE